MNTMTDSMNGNQTKTCANNSVAIMIAACVVLALIVVGGALYAQSQQNGSTDTRLAYCDQPRADWLKLPARLQHELEQNCAVQATVEAQ